MGKQEARTLDMKQRPPRIERISWGRIEIEGGKSYKDAKLYPGGSREWDWTETGTSHEQGVQPGDVEEMLEMGATVVIIGKGMNDRLRVHPETLRMLEGRGIEVHTLQTEKAAKLYNELREHEDVAGLFHSTC
jgi:hypothetical protein